jgi:hypothetical protein
MEVIQMAHAGTMDLGQSAKAARGGNPWLVLAVIGAIMVATIAAVWFTSGAGLKTSSALSRPAVDDTFPIEAQRGLVTAAGDRSFDQIEAQRGLVTAAGDRSFDQIENFRIAAGRGPLVTDYALSQKLHDGIPAGSVVAGGTVVVGPGDYTYAQLQQMHVVATAPTASATSGTFHAGQVRTVEPITLLPGITTIDNPVKRDRVGGP